QGREPAAEGRIQTLNVGRVETTAALTRLDQRCCLRPLLTLSWRFRGKHTSVFNHPAGNRFKTTPLTRFNDLRQYHTGPFEQRRASPFAAMTGTAKRIADLLEIGRKTIKDNQNGATQRAGAHLQG